MNWARKIVQRVLPRGMKRTLRRWAAGPSRWLAVRLPNRWTLGAMVICNELLTSPAQMGALARAIRRRPCRLLVFGLGNDSLFFRELNAGGRTVFLEDDEVWFSVVMKRHPQLEAYPVRYTTRLGAWRDYLENPRPWATALPPEVTGTKWDIIFVDGPKGFNDDCPGRMESLRLAAELVARPGEVFVHDCDRPAEALFSTHFLKPEHLRDEVGSLCHYVFPVTGT